MSDPKGPKLELPDDLAAEIAGTDTQSNAASAAGDESAAPDSAGDVAADAGVGSKVPFLAHRMSLTPPELTFWRVG